MFKKFNIRNFEEFINESEKSSKLARFYMLVKKPFPLDSEKVLGKMIGDGRNTLFDQVSVNKSNYDKIKIEQNVPILNFTEDNDIVKMMIDDAIIESSSLYNKPTESSLVSDKVSFHKQFEKSKFVPKTVFSVKEASKLKFPIIAKPSNGKSAEGIKKFDTLKELEESKEIFDVFSETVEINNEFRCFCFKDSIIELNERIKVRVEVKDERTKVRVEVKDERV